MEDEKTETPKQKKNRPVRKPGELDDMDKILDPVELPTSRALHLMIERLNICGATPEQIINEITKHMQQTWNEPGDWVEVKVLLPKNIYVEQLALVKKCRLAINAMDRDYLPAWVYDNEGPSIPDSVPDSLVFGHLIVRGANDVIKSYQKKAAELRAMAIFAQIGEVSGADLFGLKTMMSNTRDQMNNISNICDGKAAPYSEEDDKKGTEKKQTENTLPGYQ
jgi:hypothetical protein